MNIRVWFISIIVLCLACACSAAQMPTPTLPVAPSASSSMPLATFSSSSSSASLPLATARVDLPWLPTPVSKDINVPPYVPACQGIQVLDQQFKLPWDKWDSTKLDRVIKHQLWNNWTYYRCAQSVSAVASFYHQWMPQPPYNWFEDSFEEQSAGTLAIYNDSKVSAIAGYRWVYLMFIPDATNVKQSLMAVTWWNAPYTC